MNHTRALPPEPDAALEAAARAAARHSYSPYSRFAVGAALRTADGTLVSGCNVENASYGLSICAERAAIAAAVGAGHRRIVALAVYTPTPQPTTPCGACRQVLAEFCDDAALLRVVCVCDSTQRVETTLAGLLPGAFGAQQLSGRS